MLLLSAGSFKPDAMPPLDGGGTTRALPSVDSVFIFGGGV